MDVFDVLVEQTRELAEARYELAAYRGWFRVAVHSLHGQRCEIESLRRDVATVRDEYRQFREQIMITALRESEQLV